MPSRPNLLAFNENCMVYSRLGNWTCLRQGYEQHEQVFVVTFERFEDMRRKLRTKREMNARDFRWCVDVGNVSGLDIPSCVARGGFGSLSHSNSHEKDGGGLIDAVH